MRPKSKIYTPKRDDEHPRLFLRNTHQKCRKSVLESHNILINGFDFVSNDNNGNENKFNNICQAISQQEVVEYEIQKNFRKFSRFTYKSLNSFSNDFLDFDVV